MFVIRLLNASKIQLNFFWDTIWDTKLFTYSNSSLFCFIETSYNKRETEGF